MKEQLRRELNKTYLILSSEDVVYEESYEIEMIVHNAPKAILPLRVMRIDGNLELYYDVSAKQTMKSCAERVKLSADTIHKLFVAVDLLIQEAKEYMLNVECILLDLGHIYTKEGEFYFCYCPWEKREVINSFRGMLEEILGELDYHDTEGVELAYHLYQCACKGNLRISEILEEHIKPVEKVNISEEAFQNYFQKEEFEEEFLQEQKEEEKPIEKKRGILPWLVKFFLKKQETETQIAPKDDLFSNEEIYRGFFEETKDSLSYTEVLNTADSNTILLGSLPAGYWKLRPLTPGYTEFCITGENFLVGKKRDSVDGFIGRDTISRIHSKLFVKENRLFIADANSTNGTFVNGLCVEPGNEMEIFQGDRIMFADVGYECYNER